MRTFSRDLMRMDKHGNPESIARLFTLILQPIPEDKLDQTHREYTYEFVPCPATYDPVAPSA
jgi:hypothetical protein